MTERLADGSRQFSETWTSRVAHNRDAAGSRDQIMHELKELRKKIYRKACSAGHTSSRPGKACGKTLTDGIGGPHDDDRNGVGQSEHRLRIDPAQRDDDIGTPGDQLGGGAALVLPSAGGEAALDRKVFSFNPGEPR